MNRIFYVFIFLLFCSVITAQSVHENYVDGAVYVKFRSGALKELRSADPLNLPLAKVRELGNMAGKYGISKITRPFYAASDDQRLFQVIKIQFTEAGRVEELISELKNLKEIDYAEKVPLAVVHATPSDFFSFPSNTVHLAQINAMQAWDVFNGNSNITVAIVDNAVKWTHPDLISNTYTNTAEIANNGIDDDNNGYVDDRNGWNAAENNNDAEPTQNSMDHGTQVAGVAAAVTDNATGVAAIGWNLKIIPVQCQPDGGGVSGIQSGYEGILYAAKARARIINCSWGSQGAASITEQAVINYAWNRGCLVIASAGNLNNNTVSYPGGYNNVYCVGAVTSSDVKLGMSCFGSWVDIFAPGDNITSTIPGPSYFTNSGTSLAAPMVAGLAGLMLSRSPNMTQSNVINCINSTAANIYTVSGNSPYAGQLGAGRIDAYAAMNCAATFSAMPPVANFFAFPRNTCPNTLISFTDSSLYQPTSWSWSFQGGSPATSSASNPAVQWSNPGTYSVSLTVSNASGSNSITKLSYITVAGPGALPFQEGFQQTQFLPAGWTPNNIMNDEIYWQRVTGLGGFGTSSACAMFDNYTYTSPNDRDEMWTPKYTFTNVATARLRFDVAYARYNATFSDSLQVKLSTDCGVTWSSIYLKGGAQLSTRPDMFSFFTPTSNQWRRDSIDISLVTAGQGNVMFSFINRGRFGQPIYLDNINLVFPTPTLSVAYTSVTCVGSQVTYSSSSLSTGSYTWLSTGGSPAVSNASSAVVSYSAPGIYTVILNGANGTSTASITRTINVVAFPNLSISGANTVCSGDSVQLTGSGAASYSWSTGASGSVINVAPQSNTVYTLTGVNGGICSNTETISVTVTASPTLAVTDYTVCPGNSATLTAGGAGTYSWSNGAGTNTVSISPAASTVYTVTGTTGACSDSKTLNVFVPAISISASSETLCAGSQVTLTANGASSYTWNGNTASATLAVIPANNSTYSLSGFMAGCLLNTSKTLSVNPLPVSLVSTSNSACGNDCTGMAAAQTTLGVAPFNYTLMPGNCTTLPCDKLCPGSYTLQTSDASGCLNSASFSLGTSPELQTAISFTQVSCSTCSDGILSASVSGGVPPFSYAWAPSGGSAAIASGLAEGCYTVTVTDAGGCTRKNVQCLSFGTLLAEQEADNFGIYPNPASHTVKIEFKGTREIRVYNNLGQLVKDGGKHQRSTELHISELARGIYYIELSDAENTVRKKLILE